MRLSLLTLLTLFAVSASAQHNARYLPTGPLTETGVSGLETWRDYTLRFADGQFVHKLSLWETDGTPCQFEAGFWSATDGFSATGRRGSNRTAYRLDRETGRNEGGTSPIVTLDCGQARSERSVEAAFPTNTRPARNGVALVTPWGHAGAAAIHGVRVCTRNDSDAVNGIEVLASALNRNGSGRVSPDPALTDRFERSDCQRWKPLRTCSRGQVATQVRAYYEGGGGPLVGLGLVCQAVTMTELDGSPIRPGLIRSNGTPINGGIPGRND